jgi:hypothetical protein
MLDEFKPRIAASAANVTKRIYYNESCKRCTVCEICAELRMTPFIKCFTARNELCVETAVPINCKPHPHICLHS